MGKKEAEKREEYSRERRKMGKKEAEKREEYKRESVYFQNPFPI